jgi:hypothetical protein
MGTLHISVQQKISYNRVLRRIFGQEAGENYIMMSSVICTLHQLLLG